MINKKLKQQTNNKKINRPFSEWMEALERHIKKIQTS